MFEQMWGIIYSPSPFLEIQNPEILSALERVKGDEVEILGRAFLRHNP